MTCADKNPRVVLDVCAEKFDGIAASTRKLWPTIIILILAFAAAIYAVSESRVSVETFEKYQEQQAKIAEAMQKTRDSVIRMEGLLGRLEKSLNHERP